MIDIAVIAQHTRCVQMRVLDSLRYCSAGAEKAACSENRGARCVPMRHCVALCRTIVESVPVTFERQYGTWGGVRIYSVPLTYRT